MHDIGAKVIEVLNNDPKAKELLASFNKAAKKAKLTEAEYAKAREILLLMAIYQNKEAMRAVADDIWETVNNNSEVYC